jgi:hypothetical protein
MNSVERVVAALRRERPDGGPKIISFVVAGRLLDGGDGRLYGWGRLSPALRHANGSKTLRIGSEVEPLRIYDRYLLSSEAIGNWKAEHKEGMTA